MQLAHAQHPVADWPFLELALAHEILSPDVDLALVQDIAGRLSMNSNALDRAMHLAIHHAPKIPHATGQDFLEVVDVLLELGVPLPRNAAWIAYGDQLTARKVNPRAQDMTRLVVERGGKGVEALHRAAARWPEHTSAHAAFLDTLAR